VSPSAALPNGSAASLEPNGPGLLAGNREEKGLNCVGPGVLDMGNPHQLTEVMMAAYHWVARRGWAATIEPVLRSRCQAGPSMCEGAERAPAHARKKAGVNRGSGRR